MIRSALTVTALFGVLMTPAFADATGKWRSEKSKEGASISVAITKCGSKYCGVIAEVHNSKETDGLGTKIITGMQSKDGKSYYGGKIYAPDTKKWYSSKMVLKGNILKVSGCVAKIFCRSQNWRRE